MSSAPGFRHRRLGTCERAARARTAARASDDEAAGVQHRPRASAALAATFAAVGVLAAAGGLLSVLSYSVSRRRREFGIRTALGASRSEVRRVVLRDGIVITGSGLLLGAVFAAWLARALASLQYGIGPADPVTWSIVLVVLSLTTLAASWIPASAAARLDPLVLLREE